MKKRLIVILCCLAFPVFSPAQAAWSIIDILRGDKTDASYQRVAFMGSAVVKQSNGDAEILRGVDKWEKLRPGSNLTPGDIVRTGSNAVVVLKMNETQSFVKIAPETVLRLVPMQ